MKNKTYGYIRVSTIAQHDDRQRLAMEEVGVEEQFLFADKQSGKDFDRPTYQALLGKLGADDTLVVKSLDRLGRSYDEVLNLYSPEKTDAVALIDGRVEEIVANKNDTVASGQVIVNIVNEELPIKIKQARSNILKAETELKRSLATYNRYSRLRAYDAATAEQ